MGTLSLVPEPESNHPRGTRNKPVPKALWDAQAFMGKWTEERIKAIPTLPPLLYHYTTAQPLLSIFETRQLWATNAVYTNDQTEILHSIFQLRGVIEKDLKNRQSDPAIDSMLTVVEEFYTIVEAYLVCFCADGDLLSQWRAYGQQGGYAIGFDPEVLNHLPLAGRALLLPVVYDHAQQDALVHDLVSRWRKLFTDIPPTDDNHQVRRLGAFVFAQCFALLAIAFKSVAFSEEKEWRLVCLRQRVVDDAGPELRFRARDSLITPYLAIGAEDPTTARLPVRRIVMGPTRYPQVAGFGLLRLLKKLGYDESAVAIDPSTVPLRI